MIRGMHTERRHLLSIEQLSLEELTGYLENGAKFCEVASRDIKKVPSLRGKTIINLFLEPSTRTRVSFEIAGKWLSADTINVSAGESSRKKGETLVDTARTLEAMSPDILVVRHAESGAPCLLSRILQNTSVVNAGDGMHEHPTQALLDCLTLMQHFKSSAKDLRGKSIAIVGDVLHSRVARSTIWAHVKLGNEVRLIGPPALVPRALADQRAYQGRVSVHHSLLSGIEGADVIMALRMQLERQGQNFVPSLEEYTRMYCLSENVIARVAPNAVVLHPGPANRGVEIASELLDGPRSLVSAQVKNGVAIRMAVLFALGVAQGRAEHEEEVPYALP